MIASNLYGHRIVAERDSLNTYKKKAEKGEAKLQVINQTFTYSINKEERFENIPDWSSLISLSLKSL